MKQLNEIDTPAVLINEHIALANIANYQAYCQQHGLTLRPHIKTHKLPHLAKAQLAVGAIGITCQKISEAEVMANSGISDILITYNILGTRKLQRLLELADTVERLAVVADNEVVIDGLSKTFATSSQPLDVLIECDTGAGRCGVQTTEEAVMLAQQVVASAGINFRGLMTYPAIGGRENVQKFMTATRSALHDKDIQCEVISSGGSPDMWHAHKAPIVNEYRVGTYIYNDRSLLDSAICRLQDCALTVLATVISTPTPYRAVIDAGSKILTTDLNGLENYGLVASQPELVVSKLSEEHGILNSIAGDKTGLSVGERLQIVPNHCCVVSNMVNSVVLHRNKAQFEMVEVAARGCIT